jgi:hypothetical protein
MRRTAVALTIALCAPPAQAAEAPALCKALQGLAEAARRTGEPQRISVYLGPDRMLRCRMEAPSGPAPTFCDAAVAEGEAEAYAFPWRLNECVQTVAADPQVTTGDEASGFRGRKRLTRLAAKLGGGVRLDLSYAPGDRYDVVVWSQK